MKKRAEGYTLLELLISITMVCLIVVILGGAMRLGIRSVTAGERRIDSLERFKTSFHLIDSQIQSMVSLTYNDDGTVKMFFKGDSRSMRFSTNHSLWDARRGYIEADYRVTADERGRQALDISENIMGVEGKREARLFDSLDAISFEYFSKDPAEEKGKWVDQWTDSDSIPEKIRLTLVSGPGKLALIIPVRARRTVADKVNKMVSF